MSEGEGGGVMGEGREGGNSRGGGFRVPLLGS